MDLLLHVDVVIVVIFVEVDLARGQHGEEQTLDHARLLLRVGVLARHVHVRREAVVEWRQLHHTPVVNEGEL